MPKTVRLVAKDGIINKTCSADFCFSSEKRESMFFGGKPYITKNVLSKEITIMKKSIGRRAGIIAMAAALLFSQGMIMGCGAKAADQASNTSVSKMKAEGSKKKDHNQHDKDGKPHSYNAHDEDLDDLDDDDLNPDDLDDDYNTDISDDDADDMDPDMLDADGDDDIDPNMMDTDSNDIDPGMQDTDDDIDPNMTDPGEDIDPNSQEPFEYNPDDDIDDTDIYVDPSDVIISEPITEVEIDELVDVIVSITRVDITQISYTAFDDYDGDGAYEGFAFVGAGQPDDMGWVDGTVYYVTKKSCDEIFKGTLYYDEPSKNVFQIIDAGSRRFTTFEESYVTSLVTHVYYVEKKKPVESKISRLGDMYVGKTLADVTVTLSAYDCSLTLTKDPDYPEEWTGHSWKPYYFYYDPASKDFREYGCKTITEEELKKLVGFDLAAEIKAEGNKVDKIFKRNNGIINVNYSKTTTNKDGTKEITYSNANYNMKTKKFLDIGVKASKAWKASDFGGIYYEGIMK